MLKHGNISIFVPNNGCPNMCSFCDQFKITGKINQPNERDIDIAVENSKRSNNVEKKEIAFFGGSFTAIKREYMINLLSWAYKYVEDGTVSGIRISTRPDYINEEILSLLKRYHVTSIELGAQSMSDKVLVANNRGHSSKDVVNSSKIIKDYDFNLGLQMMTGLYESNFEDDIFTAKEFLKLDPNTVRIYPTVVMKGTLLEKLYKSGIYNPMRLEDAVSLCSKILILFESKKIRVIRVGLHGSDDLDKNFVAGPWHPAFGELCKSRVILEKCIEKINKLGYIGKAVDIFVSYKDISKFTGRGEMGLNSIKRFCPKVNVKVDNGIPMGEFLIKEGEK